MMKQVLIVCFSQFGNTQMVAERVAKELLEKMAPPISLQLINSSDLDPMYFKDTDLVIMGSPTHNMNPPRDLKPVIERLPRKSLKGAHFAAFDTTYKMSWWLDHFTAAMQIAR